MKYSYFYLPILFLCFCFREKEPEVDEEMKRKMSDSGVCQDIKMARKHWTRVKCIYSGKDIVFKTSELSPESFDQLIVFEILDRKKDVLKLNWQIIMGENTGNLKFRHEIIYGISSSGIIQMQKPLGLKKGQRYRVVYLFFNSNSVKAANEFTYDP